MAATNRAFSVVNSAQNRERINASREAEQAEPSITSSKDPNPLLAGSVEELAKTIRAWISHHNGERPPASLLYRKSDLREHIVKEVELTTGSGSGWGRRFQINIHWMAWMIEDKNGSCMLAKPRTKYKYGSDGFQAWLGGEFGFTPAAVAYPIKPENRSTKLGNKSHASEDDGSEGSVVDTSGSSRKRLYSHDPEDLRDVLASPPPLQSLTSIKRARVPVDYKEPLALPASTNTSDIISQQPRPNKRRRVVIRSNTSVPKAPPSPSVISSTAKPAALPPSRSIKRGTVAPSIPLLDPAGLRDLAPTLSTESAAAATLATTPASSSTTSTSVASRITFHFFLSNALLGAIPKEFAHCNTVTSFFDEALAAWGIMGGQERNAVMAAVSVVLVGVTWPMVIPWRNKDGFETMLEIVTKAAVEKREALDVEVRCLRQDIVA